MNNSDEIVAKIRNLLEQSPSQDATRSQLENHLSRYERSQKYLDNKEYNVAFIGNVGAGKTTSICHLLGLITNHKPILSTGSGKTTLCEVHLKESDGAMIEVEAFSDEEVQKYLYDFALSLQDDSENSDQESFKLSSEIERALRNMLDLKVVRVKSENGAVLKNDHAKMFAKEFDSTELFVNKLIERIDLKSRTETVFVNDDPLVDDSDWLHKMFLSINNGRHPQIGLAKRITLHIPNLKIDSELSITFVDTKGVDQTANRVDLDNCLNDDRTLSVLCSRFNDAPDQTCSKLIDNAIQARLEARLNAETILLVLDRVGEAEEVIDCNGTTANDRDIGRDIKADQVDSELSQKFAVRKLDIKFFDAKQNQPGELLKLLIQKIKDLRNQRKSRLEEITTSVLEIEQELKSKTSHKAQHQVKITLEPWLKKYKDYEITLKNFYLHLVEKTIPSKKIYASSVRASTNRRGEWDNLNYYHEIASGSRSQCVRKLNKLESEFNILINNMLEQDKLKPAFSLLKQVKHTTTEHFECITDLAYGEGYVAYHKKMKSDTKFWEMLSKEWGKGSGYKNRIAVSTNNWFKKNNYDLHELEVTHTLTNAWKRYVKEIEKLIGSTC